MSTDTTTTALDLDAVEARVNAATPGPWGVGNGTNVVRGLEVTGCGSYTCIQSVAEIDDDRCDWDRDEAVEVDQEDDADFIAAARQDVPRLVAEVRRLRAELDALRERTQACADGYDQIDGGTERVKVYAADVAEKIRAAVAPPAGA